MKNGKPIPKNEWSTRWSIESNPLIDAWSVTGEVPVYNFKNSSFKNDNYWHRTNGPSLTFIHHCMWFINGNEYYSIKEYIKAAKLTKEDKTALLLKYSEF